MTDIRYFNTEDLHALNRDAERLHLNRQIDLDNIDVDPDGNHVATLLIYGHNMDHAAVFHHRVRVLIKVTGSSDPVPAMLDMTDDNWKRLTPATV